MTKMKYLCPVLDTKCGHCSFDADMEVPVVLTCDIAAEQACHDSTDAVRSLGMGPLLPLCVQLHALIPHQHSALRR